MTFTATAPSDLWEHRTRVMKLTGLSGSALGVVGNAAHRSGYHRSLRDLAGLGVFHPGPKYVGNRDEDFSARMLRDRMVWGTAAEDWASAVDYGAEWPRGGRLAWLRFNTRFAAAFMGNDPALVALRAINYSPDGTKAHRYRIDREHQLRIESSTDSVDIHTHGEWYRDTANTAGRATCLRRIEELIAAAIGGETDMPLEGVQANQLRNSERMLSAMRDLVDPVLDASDGKGDRPFASPFAETMKRIDGNVLNLMRSTMVLTVDPVQLADSLSDSQLATIGRAMADRFFERLAQAPQ